MREADYDRPETLEPALEGFGLSAPVTRMIAGWDTGAAPGALYDGSGQLSQLIGRPTPPLSVTIKETLHQGT